MKCVRPSPQRGYVRTAMLDFDRLAERHTSWRDDAYTRDLVNTACCPADDVLPGHTPIACQVSWWINRVHELGCEAEDFVY